MPDKVDNLYLEALRTARTRIEQERDAFAGLDPLRHVRRAVATDGGWECTEADRWLESLTGELSGLLAAFDQAVTDISSSITAQEAEPKVEPDDWRGTQYRSTAHSNIPVMS